MKKGIHPKWYPQAEVKCVCGNSFKTGATRPHITVEVCSNCHSFFTGNQKLVDTAGRVTRYQERLAKATQKAKKPTKRPKTKTDGQKSA